MSSHTPQRPLFAVLVAGLFVGCSAAPAPASSLPGVSAAPKSSSGVGTCSSELHETTALDTAYSFDFDCAVDWLAAAGCDFDLDPDGDGRAISSSAIEDLVNDSELCQTGRACTGCDDDDSIDTVADCEELADIAYVTGSAWSDLQSACPATPDTETSASCDVEGVSFTDDEATCALSLFEDMTCGECNDLFDSRICEDAFNDSATCQIGATCTGCEDDDGVDDGVTCDEIAAYSYFGTKAAELLLAEVQTNPCSGDDTGTEEEVTTDVTVDGVTFSADQADSVLEVANDATEDQLDDDAGLNSRAAANIVAARPLASVEALAAVPYVGATALNALSAYAETWTASPDGTPQAVTATTLADEATDHGTSSSWYDALVTLERVIVTSEPSSSSSGVLLTVADPSVGDVAQLTIYIASAAGVDTSSLSVFDEVTLTGTFTAYGSVFEVLLSDATTDSLSIRASGLDYADYGSVLAAWHSTSSNPEGAVLVEATFGYSYMVPLPLFLDHPMWGGAPPAAPGDSGNEQDHSWNAAAQDALDVWAS